MRESSPSNGAAGMTDQLKEGVELRRADSNERFVAFAFAAADLVAEVDESGVITYAAGAYRSKLGSVAEAWVGRNLRDMVTLADHEALNTALAVLAERGRLLPWTVRLSNPRRTEVALAGLRLASQGRPLRMCVTFALMPSPAARGTEPAPASALARAVASRLRDGLPCEVGLLEVEGGGSEMIGAALDALVSDSLASEIAPGRFGVLGPSASVANLVKLAASLESVLREQGVPVTVATNHLPLAAETLSRRQIAQALRHALDAFAREGMTGVNEAGFKAGLASYVENAVKHTGAMRRAITQRRFELVFQPVVNLATRQVHHVEALIRPKPIPGCPTATPQDFVLLAETVGLASELDLAVASMACDAAVRSAVPVAFNVSGQSIQDVMFRDRLIAFLAAHPAQKANKLAIEMTETAQLEDIPEAARTAQMLRDLGIPFCLDDFGAGTTDVRLLRKMPADIVKLDGSYVSGITAESRERAFVTGLIEIARAAGAAVVAEHVETEAELDILRSLGVEYGQGWLFGRPGPLPVAAIAPSSRRRGEVRESWG